MDINEAETAVKRASRVGFIILAITIIKLLIMAIRDDANTITFLKDPFSYIDLIIVLVCAIMIRRFSRAAALMLLFYFVATKLLQFAKTPPINSTVALIVIVIILFIIMYYFVNGIRGAYAYHRLKKIDDPNYKAAAKWTYYVGIPFGAIFFVIITFTVLSETGALPSTQVITGSDLADEDKKSLLKERILKPNELVKWFYSAAVTNIMTNGSIITDKRIISYEMRDNKLDVYSAKLDDVQQISIVQQGFNLSFNLSDTIAEVVTNTNSFYIILSAENNGDKNFIAEIRNHIYRDKERGNTSLDDLTNAIKY